MAESIHSSSTAPREVSGSSARASFSRSSFTSSPGNPCGALAMPSTFIGSVSFRGGDTVRRSRERTSGVYIDCERKKASPGS